MFDALSVPPRLLVRALDDINRLADGIGRLNSQQGGVPELIDAARALAKSEDELSENIHVLRADINALREWLQPLHKEVTDLDETAENLERSLSTVNESILGLQGLLKKLPGI
jgi:hypothetical protein